MNVRSGRFGSAMLIKTRKNSTDELNAQPTSINYIDNVRSNRKKIIVFKLMAAAVILPHDRVTLYRCVVERLGASRGRYRYANTLIHLSKANANNL